MKNQKSFPEIIICLIAVLISYLTVFFLVSVEINEPVLSIILTAMFLPYVPISDSMIAAQTIGFFSLNLYLFLIFLLSLFFVKIFKKILGAFNLESRSFSGFKTPVTVSLVLFFFALTSTIISTSMDGLIITARFTGKSVQERTAASMGLPYYLASFCRLNFPGKHKGELISDLNFSHDPAMSFHRRLAYFIYPIDIRGITNRPADCRLISFKHNPQGFIPEKHTGMYRFDEQNIFITGKE